MFGISGSGKTCYLYAMAQILQGGAKQDDFRLSIIANDLQQQARLNEGYLQMAAGGRWPDGTSVTTEYDLCVRVQYDGMYRPIIPSLTLYDYKGGVWTSTTEDSSRDRQELMNSFAQSSSVIFLVDGTTLLQAMDDADLNPIHRNRALTDVVAARQQISFVENLFTSFKQKTGSIAPVMVVITKSDVFADAEELLKGKELIKYYLPSIFAKGSGIDSAITNVSLGTHLGSEKGTITGTLSLSTQYNIHLPIVYALYAYLSEAYPNSPRDEQLEIEKWAQPLRAMMKGKVDLFNNGYPVIAC